MIKEEISKGGSGNQELGSQLLEFEAMFNLNTFEGSRASNQDIDAARQKRYQMWVSLKKIFDEYSAVDKSGNGIAEAFRAFYMKFLRWATWKLNKRPNVWLYYGKDENFTDNQKLRETIKAMIENLAPTSLFKRDELKNYFLIYDIILTKLAVAKAEKANSFELKEPIEKKAA